MKKAKIICIAILIITILTLAIRACHTSLPDWTARISGIITIIDAIILAYVLKKYEDYDEKKLEDKHED